MKRRNVATGWSMWALAALIVATALPASAAELWLDEDFEDGVDGLLTQIVDHPDPLSNGHIGSGLAARIPDGGNWGASGRWNFRDHGITPPEEMYWRYYVKFPVGFYIEPNLRGKLPGPANLPSRTCFGGRPSTSADPCWSARMLFSRDYSNEQGFYQDGPDDRTLIGFYTYHVDEAADIETWDEDVALLDHGTWYCVEGRIDLNTPGQNDGVLEGWVDGQPAYSRSDFQWRRSNEGSLDIEMLWFDVYYGREGRTSNRDIEIHFDSLALGPERVGCDDANWEGTFLDDDDSVFQDDIEWLFTSGITTGCSDIQFCPDERVSRGQMAAFIGRSLGLPAAPDGDTFSDDNGSVFESDIERFAAAGITRGCSTTRFCPDDAVTRGQMAAFLTRAYELPETDRDYFSDDNGSIFEDAINRLAASRITTGCTTTSFCADDEVTRGQMAAFLRRAESFG
jgi:hypothetical protein